MIEQGRYDPTYVIAPPPQVGSDHQHKTAAAFFAKKNKKGGSIPASPRRSCEQNPPNDHLMTGFAGILGRCPPPPPGILLKKMLEPRDNQGLGKVRVYLRVMTESSLEHGKADFFKMDKKKKLVKKKMKKKKMVKKRKKMKKMKLVRKKKMRKKKLVK